MPDSSDSKNTVKKLLAANRSEIATRIFRGATELGLRTVAIYAEEDRFCVHRFKADEAYLVGKGLGPVTAYLSITDIIRIAKESNSDAIHPGYGFLSENARFAEICESCNIKFIGPSADLIRAMGDKNTARATATKHGVPVTPGTDGVMGSEEEALEAARKIGFPVSYTHLRAHETPEHRVCRSRR